MVWGTGRWGTALWGVNPTVPSGLPADAAYAGEARAGYTRASVFIPIYENNMLPGLKQALPAGTTGGIFDPAIFDPAIFDTTSYVTGFFQRLKEILENYG